MCSTGTLECALVPKNTPAKWHRAIFVVLAKTKPQWALLFIVDIVSLVKILQKLFAASRQSVTALQECKNQPCMHSSLKKRHFTGSTDYSTHIIPVRTLMAAVGPIKATKASKCPLPVLVPSLFLDLFDKYILLRQALPD